MGAMFTESASFSSAKFKSRTYFDHSRFLTHVPEFLGADIYDHTSFTLPEVWCKNWPPVGGKRLIRKWDHAQKKPVQETVAVMPALDQKRAYNRLRLFMSHSLQADEEQFFHRQEMRCKREEARGLHKCIYWLYEKISDYGNSVTHPLVGMAGLIVMGTAVLMLYLGMDGRVADGSVFWESLGWSISNTVPFLGYGKLYYGADYVECFHWAIKAMAGVQTLFGYILLFFLGLGLRNRFRLR